MTRHVPFPREGRPVEELVAEIGDLRTGDLDWRGGRAFSLVYHSDDAELERLLHEVAAVFLHENALNPFRYRTLLKMETEVVAMACDLFGAACGSMSSGGTESIFLAVQAARDHARATRGRGDLTVVVTDTAHPAFAKACHYLGLELVRVPHGPDGRAVPERMAEAVDERTAMLVASTPCYPFGVVDPVPAIAALGQERGVLCHVDACLGGWLLPWWERLGEQVPPWGFAVPGVTSMSADIHKYGYTFKGASVVLYADPALLEQQIFMYDDWPGGLYASSTAAGTRPGPPIAGAWATISHLGVEGYLRMAARVRTATRGFRAAVEATPGIHVTSDPEMSVFEIAADEPGLDMGGVGDLMDDRGWHLDRQQGGLHVMLSPGHDRVIDDFAADLGAAVAARPEARGGDHTYGGVAR